MKLYYQDVSTTSRPILLIAVLLIMTTLLVAACTSTSKVYEISPGTFSVTATGDGYATADRVTDLAMGKAQDMCKQNGLRLHVVNTVHSNTRMGIDTTIQIVFRCL